MARDYKHRAQGRKTQTNGQRYGRQQSRGRWRWIAIGVVVLSFVAFLTYLRLGAPKLPETSDQPIKSVAGVTADQQKKPESKSNLPHFEFYHSLSNKEIVIPEHEVKTRTREEHVGKAKAGKYMMQAGSFSTMKEAEQLTKKLAAMGIQAKVDKVKVKAKENTKTEATKIDNPTWYRVKIGPYTKMSSVDALKSRLKKSGIDVMVTEQGR